MYCHNCGTKVKANHNFCYKCGSKLEFPSISRNEIIEKAPVRAREVDYKDIFSKVEQTLKKECTLSEAEFQKHYGKFRDFHYRKYSDDHIWWILVSVVFYSGMKAAIVTSKLPALKKYLGNYRVVKDYGQADIDTMMRDNAVIKHKNKIEACVHNASIFNDLIQRHGSFASYLESFGDLQDKELIETIRQDLRRFAYIGPVTAYHIMLDLGLPVWKPDQVMCRILERLGLISSRKDIDEAVEIGREFAKQVPEPIRYIDIVMVKYGQKGDEEGFGLPQGGICLEKNPRCNVCGIQEYCSYK
jgi:DNA-3-methyladenine glycosylase I